MNRILYLILAIGFICVAHWIRVIRWQLFIEVYEKPKKNILLQALSLGYIANYVVPFKLGDILRAWYAGKKMKNGKALGLSTVIVDRYLDIVMVGVIFIALSLGNMDNGMIKSTTLFYVGITTGVLVLTCLVYISRRVWKKLLRALAGVFNAKIEASILRCAWALIWNFKDIFLRINKKKLILISIGMWVTYLISYYFFAEFLSYANEGVSWIDVFIMLFAQNSISLSTSTIPMLADAQIMIYPYYMLAYIISPLLIMLMLSLLFKSKVDDKEKENPEYLNLLPHLNPKERLDFLENYFSNKNREYVSTYLKINQGISIIRDYSAGSNATTMLCISGDTTFFRKYAFGEDGKKLYQQVKWIEENRDLLPLPSILKQENDEVYCYYDMPYINGAVGLFEYVHSMPVEYGWNMIRRTLESLENSIYKIKVCGADKEIIKEYISTKVVKNLDKIKNAPRLHNMMQYDTVFINGVAYKNLPYYEKYFSEEHLTKIFEKDTYAVIHGDLTIENIICYRDESGSDQFYIIDPNTGNVHDSPNLDYGKMLQSIHGGYEFLMSTKKVNVDGNNINFLFTKSSSYIELHECLKKYMLETFGEERTKSIYFHEIIHWLRLMPYKIAKNDKREMLFYAGMLIVMNDVIKMFEEKLES